MCWLRNKVSISKGIAGVCSSKPSSAKEMLIQDVGPGRTTVFKPNGIGPATEDMTWQLGHEFFFRWSNKGRDGEKLNPYCVVASWLCTAPAG